jgi:hypothetical protein
LNARTHSGHTCGTQDASRRLATRVTPAAERWLSELLTPPLAPGHLPQIVNAVAYRAQLAAEGGGEGMARARSHLDRPLGRSTRITRRRCTRPPDGNHHRAGALT